jgi:catechol 2,3-dioxygenase-like lactoylglutathione lyase family enzyme
MDQTPPKPSRMLETALYAEDLDAAEAFYGGTIGLDRVARVGTRHVFFRVGPGLLLIFNPAETVSPPMNEAQPVPPHGATGQGHACFAATADELEAWERRLTEAGVAIESDFRWPNGARSLYVRDPAGNSVEFAEPALWGYDA